MPTVIQHLSASPAWPQNTGLLLSMLLLFSPMLHAMADDATACTQGSTAVTLEFDSGSRWQLCLRVNPRWGMQLDSLYWLPPGAIADAPDYRVFERLSLAGLQLRGDDGLWHENLLTHAAFGLQPTDHCPDGESALDVSLDAGNADLQTRVCILEQDIGHMTFIRGFPSQRQDSARLSVTLGFGTLRWLQMIEFAENGQINTGLSLSGRLNRFENQDIGRPVGIAMTHSWRIEPGIGQADQIDEFEMSDWLHNTFRRVVGSRTLRVEQQRELNRQTHRRWLLRAADSGRGYLLDPQHAINDISVDSSVSAPFAVAVARDCEQLFADNSAQHDQCGDKLSDFLNQESLPGQELAVWYSQTARLQADSDDWPLIRSRYDGFTLLPFDFLAENPGFEPRTSQ